MHGLVAVFHIRSDEPQVASLEEVCERRVEELGHSDVIGALVEELGDCRVVGALIKELGNGNVVFFEHLGDGAIIEEEVGKGSLHKLGHSDVVSLQELGRGSAEELDDGHLEVLGGRHIVAHMVGEVKCVQELGH